MASITEKDLLGYFRVFDKDGSGTLTADEMKAVLTRNIPGQGVMMSAKDVDELIKSFDTNGDGVLDLQEFAAAMTAEENKEKAETLEAHDTLVNDKYDRRANENKKDILRLFKKLDKDNSGYIEPHEMKRVAQLFSGEEFDEKAYLEWYDTNGGSSDGKFDFKEFGW
jgi:Ca2+-binding EF-hand superfamily protein